MRGMRRWACLFREHEMHIHARWLSLKRFAVRCERCGADAWVYLDGEFHGEEEMPTGEAFLERYFTPKLFSGPD